MKDSKALIPVPPKSESVAIANRWPELIETTINACVSDGTRNIYASALGDFRRWVELERPPRFDHRAVLAYRLYLKHRELSAASINLKLSVVRAAARAVVSLGWISAADLEGIKAIRGVPSAGVRTGNWLVKADAEALLSAPDPATLKGKRDRAILGVLVGCGLRRAEAAALTFEHIRQLDGRWCIVDLIGKKGRVRTVPMPPFAKHFIDVWSQAAGFTTGRVFRAINKGDHIVGTSLNPQGIRTCVKQYCQASSHLTPHDLRRSFAKLAHKGGCPIDQIQLSLGHASIQTTERYLGVEQDLTDAPCDHLGLRVKGEQNNGR